MNIDIIQQVKTLLPTNAHPSEICYEGSEVIVYTKNEAFLKDNIGEIKKIVGQIKKRIEVRSDESLLLDEEKTKEIIKEVVPKEAGIKDVYFEPDFSKVVIHAEKPGLVIGKSGETLLSIKEKTFWTPDIKRAPVIESEIIRSIRRMLHKDSSSRKKFLNEVGKKIYTPGKDVDWIRLSALGAFRDIGRSAIFVQTPESRVLLDCGIGVANDRPYPYLDAPEFNIQDLDAVIISHSHLDHCGFLPYLYEYGYKGPVYCTRPVRDLMALIQIDVIQLAQRENKKAPYTSKGIEKMIKHSIPLEYGEVSDITPDIRVTLQNAGHILGSAAVHMNIGNGAYNLLYSGDMRFENTTILDRASTDYSRVECLILEATYGSPEDNIQQTQKDGERFLIETIKRTAARGGKVLVPVFAVGRGQDIIAILSETDLDIPIYLDGMLWDATAIHTAYPEFMSKEMQMKILHKGKNPFIDPRLKGVGSKAERDLVIEKPGPAVILSTSGMMSGGPVLEYLYQLGPDEKNTLMFVGYQGEGTLGKRIQRGWKQVQIDNNRSVDIKMEVTTALGLRGHSDFKQLMNFIRGLKTKPKKILINHGDGAKCIELAKAIHQTYKIETLAPKILDAVRLK